MFAVLGLATVSLTQCRGVDDPITGVRMRAVGGLDASAECMQRCNEEYRDAKKEEIARHKIAERACGTDVECRMRENEIHRQILERLKEAQRACKASCYGEGGGTAGR